MPSSSFCCCCLSLRQASCACITWSMVYSGAHLFSIWDDKLDDVSGGNSTIRGSVLQPPGIESEELRLYHAAYSSMFLMVLLACLVLMAGLILSLPYLLLPWIAATGLCTLGEAIAYVYILTHKKTRLDPIASFVLTLEFFVIMIQVYTVFCIYCQYREYKEGEGQSATPPNLVLFEPSSEVATARFSSVRRKSFTDSIFRRSRNTSLLLSSQKASLSRICEEESRSQCLNSEKEEKGSREPETSEERGEQEEQEQEQLEEQQLEEQQERKTFQENNQGQKDGEQEQLQEQEQKHKEKTQGQGVGEKGVGEEKHGISPGSRFLPEVFENNKITIV